MTSVGWLVGLVLTVVVHKLDQLFRSSSNDRIRMKVRLLGLLFATVKPFRAISTHQNRLYSNMRRLVMRHG